MHRRKLRKYRVLKDICLLIGGTALLAMIGIVGGYETGTHGCADADCRVSDCSGNNGGVLHGISVCPVPGAQIFKDAGVPKKEMAAGNEKECIGTAIHICTHKNNQLYYDRFKEKNQIRKKRSPKSRLSGSSDMTMETSGACMEHGRRQKSMSAREAEKKGSDYVIV